MYIVESWPHVGTLHNQGHVCECYVFKNDKVCLEEWNRHQKAHVTNEISHYVQIIDIGIGLIVNIVGRVYIWPLKEKKHNLHLDLSSLSFNSNFK